MATQYYPKAGDEVAALLKKQAKLKAKIQEAQERQRQQERQEDEKRKLVAGGVFLDFINQSPDAPLARELSQLLDKQLTRPHERALFRSLRELPNPLNSSKTNGSP
jgi:hypothetical protein